MTEGTIQDTQNSISFTPTEESKRSDAILRLGKRLTAELGLDDSVDTLGRWMAHYIAEKIHDVENASAEERPKKMEVCCDAIIKLWESRHVLPNGKRPFEDVEPAIRALESLDPENDSPRYIRLIVDSAQKEELNTETMSWFQRIDSLDNMARVLIQYCLAEAVRCNPNSSMEWLSLAEEISVVDEHDILIIRKIFQEKELAETENPDDIAREKIKNRLEKLEQFVNIADALASELRKKCK